MQFLEAFSWLSLPLDFSAIWPEYQQRKPHNTCRQVCGRKSSFAY